MKEATTEKKDSGRAFKGLVRLCGLIGITAFFLPFFNGHSGLELIQDVVKGKNPLDLLQDILKTRPGEPGTATATAASPVTVMTKVIGALFLLGMVAFTLMSTWMTITGRYSGGPLTVLIIFNVAAWILVQFAGQKAGLESTRFYMGNAELGFYISSAALFVPFIGMFFLDKSVR